MRNTEVREQLARIAESAEDKSPNAVAARQALTELRDFRQILTAWSLGDCDQMASLLLPAFLREFGKAPDLAQAVTELKAKLAESRDWQTASTEVLRNRAAAAEKARAKLEARVVELEDRDHTHSDEYAEIMAEKEATERTVTEQTTEIAYLGKRAAAAERALAELETERDELTRQRDKAIDNWRTASDAAIGAERAVNQHAEALREKRAVDIREADPVTALYARSDRVHAWHAGRASAFAEALASMSAPPQEKESDGEDKGNA